MASQNISIIIAAQDKASSVLNKTSESVKGLGDKSEPAAKKVFKLNEHVAALATIAAGAGLATHGLIRFMSGATREANNLDSALTGLNSIARAYKQDTDKAKKAAQELASDGLMTVADSATGLKNLLAAGFGLDEAVTLMKRFKDSAAFGRQGSLGFGEAIRSATEGVKNGNSILVDNAGVTKNLSRMLTDAGYSAQDLSKASDDAGVRQAIFNGILKETNAQAGDAARLAESAAGKQAVWDAQVNILQQRVGKALQPALLALLQTVTPIIEKIAGWVEQNPELAAGILITVTAVTGLVTILASLGLAITGLKPVFALFKATSLASIGGVKAGFKGLSTLIRTPLVMPAIAVAAALGAIALVVNEYNKAKAVFDQVDESIQNEMNTSTHLMKVARKQYDAGKIDKKRFQELLRIAARATGTNNDAGGWRWVGEHGPELTYVPRGSQVTPAYRSREQATAPSRSSPSVVIQNYNSYGQQDDRKFFSDLGFALENHS